jgi:hypothetical protein
MTLSSNEAQRRSSVSLPTVTPPRADLFDAIVEFVCTPAFQLLLSETTQLPEDLQHELVEIVWLNSALLAKRGIELPPGVTIERSWFEDERPTLFCVVSHLPVGYGWQKVTVTIDAKTGSLDRPVWHHVDTG